MRGEGGVTGGGNIDKTITAEFPAWVICLLVGEIGKWRKLREVRSQVYLQVYTSGHDVRVPCMAIQEVARMK